MSKKNSQNKVKSVIYVMMAFFMSCLFMLLSVSVTLQITLLNPNFILDNMNSTNYFVEKRQEIEQSLVDLGYASGLEEEFFENLLNPVDMYDDTELYFKEYYTGKSTVIDTTRFKQDFNSALDKYIEDNNINIVSTGSRDYLVKKAAGIYSSSLEIPLFARMSTYILALKNIMPMMIIVFSGLIIVLTLIVIFTNSWKHRALKYICYATSGATLTVGIIPAVVFISGKIRQINISSRSLYGLFVQCADNIFIILAFCSVILLITSVGLFFIHNNMRKKLLND